jgi:hypothetical protein
MRLIAVFVGLLVIAGGCKQVQSKKEAGKTVSVPVTGSATGENKSVDFGWGIAMWDDKEKGRLIIGLMEKKPSDKDLNGIIAKKSLFMGAFMDEPMVQFGIEFDASGGAPDIAKPGYHMVLFNNFGGKGPMTLNRSANSAGGEIRLQGDLTPGGHVTGRISGSDKFEIGDDKRQYQWEVTIDLPIE